MKDLDIYIEIKGEQVKVGEIRSAGSVNASRGLGGSGGTHVQDSSGYVAGVDDCVFTYSRDYMSGDGGRQGGPISISLPFQDEPFTPEQTRNFFSGLLPEGFMRRRVSELAHVGESDYTEILADLGSECIGAIKALPADFNEGGSGHVSDRKRRDAENTASSGHVADRRRSNAEDTAGSKDEEGFDGDADARADRKAEYVKLSNDEIAALAGEGVVEASELVMKAHLSLTGASGKVGLYLDPVTKEWFLPIGEAPSTHIVKQSHIRLGGIIANEQLCLMTARKLGIEVPDSFIVEMGGRSDGQVLLATERFDRKWARSNPTINGHKRPYRLHQEDFAQAMGIAAADKYEVPGDRYLARAFEMLLNYSARPVEDQIKLWKIVVFDYLIGNTDNHIKNISLLYSEDLSSCRLAPAYDMLSTSIYEMSTDNMAFSIGGDMSIADITRESFGREALEVGINDRAAYRQFDKMAKSFVKALTASADELTAKGFTNAEEIKDRILETGGIAKI